TKPRAILSTKGRPDGKVKLAWSSLEDEARNGPTPEPLRGRTASAGWHREGARSGQENARGRSRVRAVAEERCPRSSRSAKSNARYGDNELTWPSRDQLARTSSADNAAPSLDSRFVRSSTRRRSGDSQAISDASSGRGRPVASSRQSGLPVNRRTAASAGASAKEGSLSGGRVPTATRSTPP